MSKLPSLKYAALCTMLWALCIGLIFGAAGATAPGGTAPHAEVSATLPTYTCRRAAGAIRIDGVLDDPGWKQSAVTKPFLNWNAQGIPEYPTSARLAWDARCLYVAFQCKDLDINSPYTRRDEPLYKYDVVEIFLSPDGYPFRYFELEVSPANVLYDAKVFNPGSAGEIRVDKAWNAPGLRTAVRVDGTLNRRTDRDRGWTVEMAIPFADLGLPHAPAPGEVWRVNLYRFDPIAENRYAAWSPTLGERPDFHKPDRFGYLEFAE